MTSLPRWLHQYHGHYCNYTLRVPPRRVLRMTTNRRWHSGMFGTEDWWSVWIGLAIFAASLVSLARCRSRRLDGAAAPVGVDESHRASSPGASCSRRPAPRMRLGIRSRPGRRLTSCSRRCLRRARVSAPRRAPVRRRFHGAVRRHVGRLDRRQRAAPDDRRRGRRRAQSLYAKRV